MSPPPTDSYSVFLLDLDHTLLDSAASETAAFDETVRSAGVEDPGALFARYQEINGALWAAVERREIEPAELRVLRFQQLIDSAGLDADPHVMAETFVAGLGRHGDLYSGAREVLADLAERTRLAMVTNGFSEVQRTRIHRLDLEQYFDVVIISGEVGTSKPGTEIFDIVFDQLGQPAKTTSVMVGDSLTSDIRGGSNYGMDTCWYNPNGKPAEDRSGITHEIADLDQLRSLTVR